MAKERGTKAFLGGKFLPIKWQEQKGHVCELVWG